MKFILIGAISIALVYYVYKKVEKSSSSNNLYQLTNEDIKLLLSVDDDTNIEEYRKYVVRELENWGSGLKIKKLLKLLRTSDLSDFEKLFNDIQEKHEKQQSYFYEERKNIEKGFKEYDLGNLQKPVLHKVFEFVRKISEKLDLLKSDYYILLYALKVSSFDITTELKKNIKEYPFSNSVMGKKQLKQELKSFFKEN